MNLIVNADKNWGIGKNNELLVHIPNDMKNGLPLVKRTNIVMTKNKDYDVKGAVIVHSKEELLEELKKYPQEDIFVIGGESIYRMLLPYCSTAYVTRTDYAYDADTYFPNLDEMEEWKLTEEGEEETYFDIEYRFTKYEKL